MTTMTNGGWIEEVPQVDIELMANGNVRLTDKTDFSVDHSVDLHPIHLRLIAEKLGLVRQISASEADALRMVATLRRRMLVLKRRIDHLGSFLALHSDTAHADLTYEQDYAIATAEICDEFVADFEPPGVCLSAGPGVAALACPPGAGCNRITPKVEPGSTPVQMEIAA